jgi:hypothetical protein
MLEKFLRVVQLSGLDTRLMLDRRVHRDLRETLVAADRVRRTANRPAPALTRPCAGQTS